MRSATGRAARRPPAGHATETVSPTSPVEEADRIAALLAEYTELLQVALDASQRARARLWRWVRASCFVLFLLLGLLGSLGEIGRSALRASAPAVAGSELWWLKLAIHAAFLCALMVSVHAALEATSTVLSARTSEQGMRRRQRTLRLLVAHASQLLEHAPVPSSALRTGLELRLADAEAVLGDVAGRPTWGTLLDALVPGWRRRTRDRAARRAAWSTSHERTA